MNSMAPINLFAQVSTAKAYKTRLLNNSSATNWDEEPKIYNIDNQFGVTERCDLYLGNNEPCKKCVSITGVNKQQYLLVADGDSYVVRVHGSSEHTSRYKNEIHDKIWKDYYGG